jgi:hypothetical protein
MKHIRTLSTIVLLLTALSFSFYLQAEERPLLTASVPFTFVVANVNLPAGSYTVSILPPYNMIKVQSTDGRKVAATSAIPSQKSVNSERAKLVFHRFGNEYFLAQVWEQGSNIHRDLQSGNRARELASAGDRMGSVTILANASNRSH